MFTGLRRYIYLSESVHYRIELLPPKSAESKDDSDFQVGLCLRTPPALRQSELLELLPAPSPSQACLPTASWARNHKTIPLSVHSTFYAHIERTVCIRVGRIVGVPSDAAGVPNPVIVSRVEPLRNLVG